MKKMVDGNLVNLTSQEIADRQAEESSFTAKKVEAHKIAYYNEKLNGGITVDGIFIATGAEDRNLINGAVTRALLDGDDTKEYPYYPTGGGVTNLTNAQYKAIGAAIALHVQACLDAQAAIEGNTYNTIEEVRQAYETEYQKN